MLSNVSSPSSLIRTICGKYRVIVGASRVRSALHSSDRSTASAFERTRSNSAIVLVDAEATECRTGRTVAGPEAAEAGEAGEYKAVHGAIFFTYSFTLSFYFSFFLFIFHFFFLFFFFLFLFFFFFFFRFFLLFFYAREAREA